LSTFETFQFDNIAVIGINFTGQEIIQVRTKGDGLIIVPTGQGVVVVVVVFFYYYLQTKWAIWTSTFFN
jgi:hypothetical protein